MNRNWTWFIMIHLYRYDQMTQQNFSSIAKLLRINLSKITSSHKFKLWILHAKNLSSGENIWSASLKSHFKWGYQFEDCECAGVKFYSYKWNCWGEEIKHLNQVELTSVVGWSCDEQYIWSVIFFFIHLTELFASTYFFVRAMFMKNCWNTWIGIYFSSTRFIIESTEKKNWTQISRNAWFKIFI